MDVVSSNIMGFEDFEMIDFSDIPLDFLLERKERKFCFRVSKISDVLRVLNSEFIAVHSCGNIVQQYESTYLDTKDSQMYTSHHSGRRPRYKLRFRNYIDGEMSFFEVKHKNNKNKTIKTRMELDFMMNEITSGVNKFIEENTPIVATSLDFSIATKYKRITFVHKGKNARITLDLRPSFKKHSKIINLDEIAILELKYNKKFSINTWQNKMKHLGILTHKMSKYCVGMCLINPTLKHNLFKPTLRYLQDLQTTN